MPEFIELSKSAVSTAAEVTESDLALINKQALVPLKAEDVYVFCVNACDDQVDRDFEAFSVQTLNDLTELFPGRTVIMDHRWSSSNQVARVFDASVAADQDVHRLRLRCYMIRNSSTQPVIDAINAGILREVSVGVSVKTAKCSLCGKDYYGGECLHIAGKVYNGTRAHVILDGAADAYELSFVAVPAQREAGVTKHKRPCDKQEPQNTDQQKEAAAEAARIKIRERLNNL